MSTCSTCSIDPNGAIQLDVTPEEDLLLSYVNFQIVGLENMINNALNNQFKYTINDEHFNVILNKSMDFKTQQFAILRAIFDRNADILKDHKFTYTYDSTIKQVLCRIQNEGNKNE